VVLLIFYRITFVECCSWSGLSSDFFIKPDIYYLEFNSSGNPSNWRQRAIFVVGSFNNFYKNSTLIFYFLLVDENVGLVPYSILM